MAVDFDNYISSLQACVVCRTSRLHVLYYSAMNVARDLQLITSIWTQFAQAQSPAAFFVVASYCHAAVGRAHRFQSDWNARRLAFAHHLELDSFTGPFLPDFHLQLSGIRYGLPVQFGDDIANAQARLASGRVRLDFGYNGSVGVAHPEELGVIRSHIRNANPDKAMTDFAVANQGLNRGFDNLRGNREAHSGE